MRELTDYEVAIRALGSPPAPEGVEEVDLISDEPDVAAATIDALQVSGLKPEDFKSRVVFLAPKGPSGVSNR